VVCVNWVGLGLSGFGPHLLLVVGLGVNFGDVRGAISRKEKKRKPHSISIRYKCRR
jgi:hypothetical protein